MKLKDFKKGEQPKTGDLLAWCEAEDVWFLLVVTSPPIKGDYKWKEFAGRVVAISEYTKHEMDTFYTDWAWKAKIWPDEGEWKKVSLQKLIKKVKLA